MGTMSLDLLKEQQKEKQTELLQTLQSEEASEEAIAQAFADYAREVKEGTFPAQEHTFAISEEVIEKLY